MHDYNEQRLAAVVGRFSGADFTREHGYEGPGARIATDNAADGTPPLVSGGPAQRAGLRPGDVVTAIDGTKVADSAELIVAIRSHRPGETVTLTVKRSGAERQIRVTLAATKG